MTDGGKAEEALTTQHTRLQQNGRDDLVPIGAHPSLALHPPSHPDTNPFLNISVLVSVVTPITLALSDFFVRNRN